MSPLLPTTPSCLVELISSSIVKPQPRRQEEEKARFVDLSPGGLATLSNGYAQVGFLFKNPSSSNTNTNTNTNTIYQTLKESLSHALFHFYPLAGRLSTHHHHHPSSSIHVSIHCNDAGAELIHAVAPTVTLAHVLSPTDGPRTTQSFFPLNDAVNFDGHSLPLLSAQLTRLAGDEGFFLACSINHAVADGTSFFHFVSSWFEIATGNTTEVSLPPVIDLWSPVEIPIRLPFTHADQFIERFSPPPSIRTRIFHFTRESIWRLKSKAIDDDGNSISSPISLYQALIAHVWRSITRARKLAVEEEVSLRLAIDIRSRLEPQLTVNYFGCYIQSVTVRATAGDLLASGLGGVARLMHESVASHTNGAVRATYEAWVEGPVILHLSRSGHGLISIGGSPRFGVNCGWGDVVAYRRGPSIKFDGKVMAFPGCRETGSVDLEISLSPEVMCSLESDDNFIGPQNDHRCKL